MRNVLELIAENKRKRMAEYGLPPEGIPDFGSPEERERWFAEHRGESQPSALGPLPAIGQFTMGNTAPIETPDRPYATQPAAVFDKAEEERKRREALRNQMLMGLSF